MSSVDASTKTDKDAVILLVSTAASIKKSLTNFLNVLCRSLAAVRRYDELARLTPAQRARRGLDRDSAQQVFEEFFS